MPSFSLRHPYFVIVLCMFGCVLGITSIVQMPVDMFPPINIPVVLVATFYNGMPPEQIEADITDTFERFFTNSILIVDFANVLRGEGRPLRDAVVQACRIRLRPILMTSLATVVGLLPMAFKIETGSEAYAPLARAIIGGLVSSIILTIFVVPAAYLLMYRKRGEAPETLPQETS